MNERTEELWAQHKADHEARIATMAAQKKDSEDVLEYRKAILAQGELAELEARHHREQWDAHRKFCEEIARKQCDQFDQIIKLLGHIHACLPNPHTADGRDSH